MTKQELIEYCLTYSDAYEDYPFDDFTTLIRHRGNRKMFALISEYDSLAYINLKCEPMKADFLRTIYQSVTPGYHMNKTHWNTVTMQGEVPFEALCEMVQESFDLTKPRRTEKKVKE